MQRLVMRQLAKSNFGIVSKAAKSPKARLEYNAIAIYCALLRAGRDPHDAIYLAASLAAEVGATIDEEVKP